MRLVYDIAKTCWKGKSGRRRGHVSELSEKGVRSEGLVDGTGAACGGGIRGAIGRREGARVLNPSEFLLRHNVLYIPYLGLMYFTRRNLFS